MPTTPPLLATVDDFRGFGSNAQQIQTGTIWTTTALTRLMRRATISIESRCQRRLALFTGKIETHRAYGIAPDEYGEQGDLPMTLTGALGWSQAAALGVSDMVRCVWLDEAGVCFPDQWTYSITRVQIVRTFGDNQTFVGPQLANWQGPEPDTGFLRMPIGIYCPIGSTIRIWYSGGYTPVPDDLNLAAVLQALKYVLLGAEPEFRKDLSTADLDEEILTLIAAYVR